MKPQNETLPNGPASCKMRARNKKNTKPIIRVGCAAVDGDLVASGGAENFRAQMHRRYTVPFVFTPWHPRGLNE